MQRPCSLFVLAAWNGCRVISRLLGRAREWKMMYSTLRANCMCHCSGEQKTHTLVLHLKWQPYPPHHINTIKKIKILFPQCWALNLNQYPAEPREMLFISSCLSGPDWWCRVLILCPCKPFSLSAQDAQPVQLWVPTQAAKRMQKIQPPWLVGGTGVRLGWNRVFWSSCGLT